MRVPVLRNVRRADLATVVWIPALPPKISDRGTGQSMAALLRGPAAAVGITVTGYETPPDPGMTRLPRPPAAAEQPTLRFRISPWWSGLSVNDPPLLKAEPLLRCPARRPIPPESGPGQRNPTR